MQVSSRKMTIAVIVHGLQMKNGQILPNPSIAAVIVHLESDLKDKLEVLAPTGLTRDDIWPHLFLTKQRKNPYEEGCYTGEDVEDVKQKWEDKKHYFEQYKKDGACPPCIDLDTLTTLQHFRQLKTQKQNMHVDGRPKKVRTYQEASPPDVRDEPLQDDNAAASCSDGKLRWRCWDGDYAMGFQHHT